MEEENCATLKLHISNLEAKQSELMEERERINEDFSQQRAKLKELFLQKEEELIKKSDDNAAMEIEIDTLQNQIQLLERELEEARSQVTIAECTAENEVEVERRKCEEEIASVQQIMREELSNAEKEIHILRTQAKKFETEKIYYRGLYEKRLETPELDLKKDSILSPGVLSAVTKSIAKRVPSLSPAHSVAGASLDKGPGQSSNLTSSSSNVTTPVTTATSPSSSEPSENLEESMQRAQKDAVLLRSLVVPLEEEIVALKHKLREQDAQLRTHESQEQMAIKTADVIGPLFQGKSAEELVQELDEKLQGIKNTLEVEKASRADLELYTAILNTQKIALTDNISRLREQLNEQRQLYEDERREHNELKNTWQRANDQFLEAQRMHLADMRRIRSLLSAEQLLKFHELQRVDSKDDDSPTIKNFDHLSSTVIIESRTSSSIGKLDNFSASKEELAEKSNSEEDTVSTVVESGQGSDANSLEGDNPTTLLSKFSPEKMPQLTDDQKRALSGIEGEKMSDSLEDPNNSCVLPSNQRVVSETEWRRLQEEIKKSRTRMSASCPLCAASQVKLKKVESDLKESEKQLSKLEQALNRQKEDLERESLYRKQTEEEWKQKAENFDTKAKSLQMVIERVSKHHSAVVGWSKKTTDAMEEKLRLLTQKREAAQLELTRLQRENDNLVGKHSQRSQEMQNEIINLPDSMEDMQLLLLRYREDIIAAKVAKEHVEDTLNAKILILKDQVCQEQHEKASMEDKLSSDIEKLRKRTSVLEATERTLESETKLKNDLESRVSDIDHKANEANKRSQQLIGGLKQQVDELSKAKSRLERETMDLKNRVASLQHDLETSEAVQRDFVRLSQSLQVQLEKIRQSEKEVRWQHEEDVEDCGNCKQRFSAVGRRKHHCKHCGKIFCSECVTKIVPSGPNGRTSRVCDVCHTLLVQDATPFFSTEPPQSPD